MKKVVCITGAARGLGRELVAILHTQYQVVAIDLESDVLPSVAKKFDADYFFCDITNDDLVQETINQIIKKYGKIDCLINNAGTYVDGALETNDPKAIRRVLEVNTIGTINMCRFVVPHMQKQKSGTIININSQAGLYPRAMFSVYHASKWAITGFTQSLRLELVPHKIKVIGIYPGLMQTGFTLDSAVGRDMSEAIDVEEVAKTIKFVLSCGPHVTFPEIGIRHI